MGWPFGHEKTISHLGVFWRLHANGKDWNLQNLSKKTSWNSPGAAEEAETEEALVWIFWDEVDIHTRYRQIANEGNLAERNITAFEKVGQIIVLILYNGFYLPGRTFKKGTLPETNIADIAPENRPWKRRFLLETVIFRFHLKLGQGIWFQFQIVHSAGRWRWYLAHPMHQPCSHHLS